MKKKFPFIILVAALLILCFTSTYSQADGERNNSKKSGSIVSPFLASLISMNNISETNPEVSKPSKPTAVNDSVINTGTGVFGYRLYDNFPNPFETKTEIKFSLYYPCNVQMIISDQSGRQRVILTDKHFEAGENSVVFDNSVYDLPAGVYYYCLMTEYYTTSRRMIICK
jgi:hypothetical protein